MNARYLSSRPAAVADESGEHPSVRPVAKSTDPDVDTIRRALDNLARRPPKKCVRSPQEQAEHEACEAVKLALESDGESQRSLATRVLRNEKLVRDWVTGAKAAPIWLFFRLRRDGQMALLNALLAAVRKEDEPESGESERGAA